MIYTSDSGFVGIEYAKHRIYRVLFGDFLSDFLIHKNLNSFLSTCESSLETGKVGFYWLDNIYIEICVGVIVCFFSIYWFSFLNIFESVRHAKSFPGFISEGEYYGSSDKTSNNTRECSPDPSFFYLFVGKIEECCTDSTTSEELC